VTEKQAERAQQAIQGVARLPNTSALALDILNEDAFEDAIFNEDDEDPFEDDYDAEIDRQEEDNLEAYQDQPYLYRVSFVLKCKGGYSYGVALGQYDDGDCEIYILIY
jgi:broad specificity phosphatase PhoE